MALMEQVGLEGVQQCAFVSGSKAVLKSKMSVLSPERGYTLSANRRLICLYEKRELAGCVTTEDYIQTHH